MDNNNKLLTLYLHGVTRSNWEIISLGRNSWEYLLSGPWMHAWALMASTRLPWPPVKMHTLPYTHPCPCSKGLQLSSCLSTGSLPEPCCRCPWTQSCSCWSWLLTVLPRLIFDVTQHLAFVWWRLHCWCDALLQPPCSALLTCRTAWCGEGIALPDLGPPTHPPTLPWFL